MQYANIHYIDIVVKCIHHKEPEQKGANGMRRLTEWNEYGNGTVPGLDVTALCRLIPNDQGHMLTTALNRLAQLEDTIDEYQV